MIIAIFVSICGGGNCVAERIVICDGYVVLLVKTLVMEI